MIIVHDQRQSKTIKYNWKLVSAFSWLQSWVRQLICLG